MSRIATFTPPGTPRPIGPYSHISQVGQAFRVMLESVTRE
jgi:hypothetical protein